MLPWPRPACAAWWAQGLLANEQAFFWIAIFEVFRNILMVLMKTETIMIEKSESTIKPAVIGEIGKPG